MSTSGAGGTDLGIGKVFHLTQIVTDLDAAQRWYEEVFDARLLYRGFDSRAKRDACLLWFGDMMVEPLSPADVDGAEDANVARFHAKYGERIFNVAWYVDELDAVFAALQRAGIRQYGMNGEQIDTIGNDTDLSTHPRETPGPLEFAIPGYIEDPRLAPDWSMVPWTNSHPLTIERTSHVTFVVHDLQGAKELFLDVLGARLLREDTIVTEHSALLAFGEGPDVELKQPRNSGSDLATALETFGESFYSVAFKVRDLASARAHLVAKGVRIASIGPRSLVVDPADSFNVRMSFTSTGPYGRF